MIPPSLSLDTSLQVTDRYYRTRKPIMNMKILFFGTIVSIASLCAASAADTYKIDPAHSTVGFSVTHMVINTVHGKFDSFSGFVVVDGKTIQSARGTMETKSVDTGVAMRDKDLRSPNFFDAEKYPEITFVSKGATQKDGETVLTGEFTMHGVTKELSLPVKMTGPIQDPWGNTRIGLSARTTLNRKDYGLNYSKTLEAGGLVVGNEIEIEINAEATKAK